VRLLSIFRLRLRSLFSRNKIEEGLDEELRYHLEQEIEEAVAGGMTERDARAEALRSIVDIEQRKEECRDMRGLNLIENSLRDFHYAVRQLRRSPGFASIAIFTLALGVCATLAIFGLVDAALIKPLPYRDPARLAGVFEADATTPRGNMSFPNYRDWKSLSTVFSSMDAFGGGGGWSFTLSNAAGMQHVAGIHVTAGFFRTLGVTPIIGRDFRSGEDSLAAPETVLLSYGAWQARFGGNRNVLGQTVTLDGLPHIVIGVLSSGFHFAPAGPAEFWGTLRPARYCEQERGCSSVYCVARLKDGVSMQTALAAMKSVARQLARQYPKTNRDQSANVLPLREVIAGDIRPILLTLMSGAGLLLLIACINVSSLLLSRSDSRRREVAVRNALGASWSRLFRQFITEALVLAIAGSLLGLLLAGWGMQFLLRLIPADMLANMPYLDALGLNARVAVMALAISLMASVLFALTPLVRISFPNTAEGLKEGSRGSAGTTWRRFGANLVAVELALTVVLLVSAGLLGMSLYRLLQVNIGFRADHVATLLVEPPPGNWDEAQFVAFKREVVDSLSHLPGVQSVGASDQLPLGYGYSDAEFQVVGRPYHGQHNDAYNRRVSSGYFTALGARLERGHYFTPAEEASKRAVVIVNRTLANRYFPGEDPVGKQIAYSADPRHPMQIVGVVADIQEGTLDAPAQAAFYVPFDQSPNDRFCVVVRSARAEQPLFASLREAIHRINPGFSTSYLSTMTDKVNESPTAYLHRSSAWLAGSFAAVAFLLGVIGLYGVVAYSVSRRTREIGVRISLGAEPRSIYRMILGEATRLAIVGTAAGIVCSAVAAALMRRMLFGVRTWDLSLLGLVAAVLVVSALLASYVPARRAASINPVDALRSE
jgi:macrolide transport system ATP-binding/permease protein